MPIEYRNLSRHVVVGFLRALADEKARFWAVFVLLTYISSSRPYNGNVFRRLRSVSIFYFKF